MVKIRSKLCGINDLMKFSMMSKMKDDFRGFLGVISRPVIEFATSNVQKKMFQFSFIEKNGYQIAKWDKYFMLFIYRDPRPQLQDYLQKEMIWVTERHT